MSLSGRLSAYLHRLLFLVLLAPMLAACGGDESASTGGQIAWNTVVPPTATPEPMGVGGANSPLPPTATNVSPEQIRQFQPNELGVVPILEYHMITTNPDEETQFVRLADDMRADLQWLYDHEFYVVPLSDVINNMIQAPTGKHPVALTFDDGTSTQFAFIKNDEGELVPDPDTAVGILEEFYAVHPEFGRGGHFAVLAYNAFAMPDESQEPYFAQKIQWLAEHGYEIGNHTWQHTDLTDIPNKEFVMTIAEPMIWANDILGDTPANASGILTLPYGSVPNKDSHPGQREMMRHGFSYKGQEFQITSALLVGAEPAVSPASTLWDPMWIPRIQMFDESTDFWFGRIEDGTVIPYTSDGNPDTIVVPHPLSPIHEGQLDVAMLSDAGKSVIQYDPTTGETMAATSWSPVAIDSSRRIVRGRIRHEAFSAGRDVRLKITV